MYNGICGILVFTVPVFAVKRYFYSSEEHMSLLSVTNTYLTNPSNDDPIANMLSNIS